MRTKHTPCGTCTISSHRGEIVVNFSDPTEGRRVFADFDALG